MEKEAISLHLKLMIELGIRQIGLMDKISGAIREVTLIKSSLPLRQLESSLNEADYKLQLLEDEAVLLEKAFNEPTLLLTEQEKHELNANQTATMEEMVTFATKVKGTGEATDRRDMIYSLLDRLDRRISDRRSASRFRKTQYVAILGVGIAIFALIMNVTSLFRLASN